MDSAFIQERIDKTKLMIIAYEDACAALAANGVQEYMLDTGQSKQKVTKFDLKALNDTLDSLYNRLTMFEARMTGSGTTVVRPAW